MKRTALTLITLLALSSCRPAPPADATDVPTDDRSATSNETSAEETSETTSLDEEASAVAPSSSGTETPRVAALAVELAATVSAALAGRSLPESSIVLPGTRGEQLVSIIGEGFPQGDLTVEMSMLKLDVTLDGCGEDGGLTIGLLQSSRGLRVVGLGDQFTHSSGAAPRGLGEAVTVGEWALDQLRQGSAPVFGDEDCQADFESPELCGRVFPQLPNEAALARYREMLASCDATPSFALPIISLWLRDESGTSFQGMAHLGLRDGRVLLTRPVALGPGLTH